MIYPIWDFRSASNSAVLFGVILVLLPGGGAHLATATLAFLALGVAAQLGDLFRGRLGRLARGEE